MAVDLTGLKLVRMNPVPLESGGRQVSPLNGATEWINRLGNRWSFECETPPMELEPDGRNWSARLTSARRRGALLPIAQPGFRPSVSRGAKVAAETGAGRFVPLKACQPNEYIAAGRWVSFVVGDRRYADQIAVGGVVSDAGTITIELQGLLRAPLADNTVAELVRPMVQGSLSESLTWAVDRDEVTSFSFVIAEDD